MHQEQIDRLKVAAVSRQELFVAGRLSVAISGARLDVVSPIDGYTDTKIAWISL